jgi:predicted nucleic acid-binding protein
VSLLVDTSVWLLALRRDVEQSAPEVLALSHALLGADQVFITGLVLQELLQGFAGPKDRAQLVERLSAIPAAVVACQSERWTLS